MIVHFVEFLQTPSTDCLPYTEILTAAEQAWGAHSQTRPTSSHLRSLSNTSVPLGHGWIPHSLTMKMHPAETTKGIPGSELPVHTLATWAGRRQQGLESH